MLRFALVPLLLSTLLGCGSPPAPKVLPAPTGKIATKPEPWPFSAEVLPEPPWQRSPRNMRDHGGLPEGFVRAMERLFAHGFGDSRGLAYYEVEITLTTQPEGPGQRVALKAFVLPNEIQGKPFGIAWNGLVYPLESIGKVANVATDVQELLRRDAALCAQFRDIVPDGACLRSRAPRAEIHSLKLEEILPSHIAILWARGQTKLAKVLWDAWIAGGRPEDTPEVSQKERDIYWRFAEHFRHVVEDRAFWAHVRGDNDIALASLHGLAKIKSYMAESAKELGIKDEGQPNEAVEGSLLVEQEIRAERKGKTPLSLPEKLPMDQGERISLLIDLLGEVKEPVFARLGDENRVLEDAILQALIAEGVAAMVPLANVLEKDRRLSRSVWYQPHGIHLFSVAEIAEITLREIAKSVPFDAISNNSTRQEKAERFRQAGLKYASISPAERWFGLLANDSAGSMRWLIAATRIVGPTDAPRVTVPAGELMPLFMRKDGVPPPRLTELSAKKNPSVLDLFEKRMQALALSKESDDISVSCSLGVLAALWDTKLAAKPLAEETTRIRDALGKLPKNNALFECLAVLYVARAAGGDEKGLDDYANWIRNVNPADAPRPLDTWIMPMMWAAKRRSIIEAGNAMFGTKNSPWIAVLQRREMDSLLDPTFLVVPGMRELLLGALDDKTVAGEVTIDAQGSFAVSPKDPSAFEPEEGTVDAADITTTRPGTRRTLRACDPIAFELGRRAVPAIKFQLYWSEKRKDDALKTLKAQIIKASAAKP